jgi:hypothetical protein
MFKRSMKYPLTLDLQYFAEGGEGGEGGGAGSQGSEGGGAEGGTDNGGQGAKPIFTPEQQAQIDSLLKSAQDQIRNEYGKKQKELQTTIDQLKNQGKSKEQLAKEAEEKLQQGQAELLKSKNEFYAVRQLAKEGLDAELLDFVVTNEGDDEDARNGATDAKIKAITDIINKQVKAQVDAKFKDAGYNPGNGSGANGASGFKSVMDTIRANQIKK